MRTLSFSRSHLWSRLHLFYSSVSLWNLQTWAHLPAIWVATGSKHVSWVHWMLFKIGRLSVLFTLVCWLYLLAVLLWMVDMRGMRRQWGLLIPSLFTGGDNEQPYLMFWDKLFDLPVINGLLGGPHTIIPVINGLLGGPHMIIPCWEFHIMFAGAIILAKYGSHSCVELLHVVTWWPQQEVHWWVSSYYWQCHEYSISVVRV